MRCSISSLRELSFLTTQTQADLGFKGWDDCLIAYLLFAHIVRTDSPSGPYPGYVRGAGSLDFPRSAIRKHPVSGMEPSLPAWRTAPFPARNALLWDVQETPMRKSDGHRMKNAGYAARSAPRIAYRALRPDRPSGSGVHRSPASPMRRSRYPIPSLESHIKAHANPIKSHNEHCCIPTHALAMPPPAE